MGKIRSGIGISFSLLILISSLRISEGEPSTPRTFVRDTISSKPIVIFSKSYCPRRLQIGVIVSDYSFWSLHTEWWPRYSRRAKAVFQEMNRVPYVIELDQRGDGVDIQDALQQMVGRRTVPQVFISGRHIGGSDDTYEAYENGDLAKLLENVPE